MQIIKSKSVLIFFFLTSVYSINSQNIFEQQGNIDRISPTELGIPASPVFDLMGVTPSQVIKSSDIKDFKVDWSFKSWSLSPNISFEAQPIWEFFYNRKPLKKYRQASTFSRRLASTNISLGTVRDEFGNRRIGFGGKIGLYKERDALLLSNVYDDIENSIISERKNLDSLISVAKKTLDTIGLLQKQDQRKLISSLESELFLLNKKRNDLISERANIINAEYWNSSWIDLGFGRVKSYQSDQSGNLTETILNRSTAKGMWINTGIGIGKYLLASGLIRGHLYNEEVTFTLENTSDFTRIDTTTIASNVLMTYGFNLRYGNPVFNFFAEVIYERRGLKTPFEAVQNNYETPSNFTIIEESVNWTKLEPIAFSFGGDWRIKRSIILNYSMRLGFDKENKLSSFLPVVSISCLMR